MIGWMAPCGIDDYCHANSCCHDQIGDPTTDAILDRLFHNAYRLALRGKSMRPGVEPLQNPDATDSQ